MSYNLSVTLVKNVELDCVRAQVEVTSDVSYGYTFFDVWFSVPCGQGQFSGSTYGIYTTYGSTRQFNMNINFTSYKDYMTGIFKVQPVGASVWSAEEYVTNEAGEPSSNYPYEYYPSYYPEVTSQWVWGAGDGPDPNGWHGQADSCVANALVSLKEIQEYRELGVQKKFSIGWIYGNRLPSHLQGETMNYDEAIPQLINDGVPEYTELPENQNNGPYQWAYPDIYYYFDWTDGGQTIIGAKTLVENNYNNVIEKARKYKVGGYTKYTRDFINIEQVKAGVVNHGGVLVSLRIANNFDWLGGDGSTGIVEQPDWYRDNDWHAVVIIGWKRINGKLYWITHNNWGAWWWGDNGRCYMPYDYLAIGDYYVIPDVPNPISPPSFAPVIASRFPNGFKLTWGASTDELLESYTIRLYNTRTGIYSHYERAFYYTDISIYSLENGTTYEISVRANGSNGGSSPYTTSNTATVNPCKPEIVVDNVTETSITVRITNMTGTWSGITLDLYINGNVVAGSNRIAHSVGDIITWTGLTPGVQYEIQALSFIEVSITLYSLTAASVTAVTTVRPTNFSWTFQKESGQPFKLTETEWNDFANKINEFRSYKGLSSYFFSTAYNAADFLADMFNQAVSAIAGMNPPTAPPSSKLGVSDVVDPDTADDVLAAYLNDIVSSLNSIQ
ncbi:C1 family peptidase [Petroclostridium sp. X23]|uniref:C1 family peptidase n=1 Tax=Petroclostridium sp. X23 TaxID=3045146 RepID=UPI0024ADF9CD|nr:C1 family peptidase [Petroclostridium sp. X23]WHH59179.1 C1 family peptidase [Petroclostridium sp. X23]